MEPALIMPSVVATAVPAVTNDLPPGWKQAEDKHGKKYYYNGSTGGYHGNITLILKKALGIVA